MCHEVLSHLSGLHTRKKRVALGVNCINNRRPNPLYNGPVKPSHMKQILPKTVLYGGPAQCHDKENVGCTTVLLAKCAE